MMAVSKFFKVQLRKNNMMSIMISIIICVIMIIFCFMYIDELQIKTKEELDSQYQNLDMMIWSDEAFTKEQLEEIDTVSNKAQAKFSLIYVAIKDEDTYNYASLAVIDYASYKKIKIVDEFEQACDDIILKDYVANKYQLKQGEYIDLDIAEKTYTFKIAKIVTSGDTKNSFDGDILVTKDALEKQGVDMKSLCIENAIALDLGKEEDKVDKIRDSEVFSECEYAEYVTAYQNNLHEDEYFILAMYTILAIGIICVYSIIKNSFNQLLIAEIGSVALLKSIGISKKDEKKLWYAQTILISSSAWVAGMLIGIFMVNITFRFIFDINGVLLPSLICVGTAALVTVVPNLYITHYIIKKIEKMSIVDMLKRTNNTVEIETFRMKTFIIKEVIFVVCMIATKLVLTHVVNRWLYVGLSIFDMVIFSIFVCEITSYLMQKIINRSQMGLVKALYINGKQISNMITSMTLSVMLFVGMIGVFENVRNTFVVSLEDTLSYDYEVYMDIEDQKALEQTFDENIKQYALMSENDVLLDDFWCTFVRIDPSQMTELYNLKYSEDTEAIITELNKNKENIVVSERLLNRLGLQVGEDVVIDNVGNKKQYHIIASCNYIGYKVFGIDDFGSYNKILIKDSGINMKQLVEICSDITFDYNVVSLQDIIENEEIHINKNLSSFSTLALIVVCISTIILLNTLKMSINEHKMDLAILNTLGISKRDTIKVILFRATIYIVMSLLSGELVAFEFIRMSSAMMSKMLFVNVFTDIHVLKCFAIGGLICVALVISTICMVLGAIKNNKESLIVYTEE